MKSTTSPKPIDRGALDAALNLAFMNLRYAGDKRAIGAYNLNMSAEAALHDLLGHRAPDVRDHVLEHYGFELGVDVARIIVESPLTDCSIEIAAIVDQAIENARHALGYEAA